MKTKIAWLAAAAALALGAGAAASWAGEPRDAEREAAQDAGGAPASGMSVGGRHGMRLDREDRDTVRYRRGADLEQNLSDLLQLRPEQQPALEAFMAATHPPRGDAHDHLTRFDRGDDGRTTLQKLDDMQARMAEQQAATNRKIAAIKAFYAQLDARQKTAFDALPMLMVIGPSVGPMMIPRPMPIADHPPPPTPPLPPTPPRS